MPDMGSNPPPSAHWSAALSTELARQLVMGYVTAIFHYTIILCVTVQEWIQENDVLSIVLRDSLHQPQYVEKLEKILRFMIKEKALSLQNLDKLWEAQVGWFVCVFTLFSTL